MTEVIFMKTRTDKRGMGAMKGWKTRRNNIKRQAAEIERLRVQRDQLLAALKQLLQAWDDLPVGNHSIRVIQNWLRSPEMRDGVTKARTAVAAVEEH